MRVLFICLGNICRSPTAEAIARHMAGERGLASRVTFDSAAIENYHPGKAPDRRSQRHARERGYDLSALRARVVTPRDFDEFDLILAMDESHMRRLRSSRPAGARAELALFLDSDSDLVGQEVPDPYYGGEEGFEEVLDLCERALESWFERWAD
ncbi:MAG: low molecular weight protein-tyrosine-phosphatase [Planctomycetota bacterium]